MILKTCPELLDRTGQTVQTSRMEEKSSLWDMHTPMDTAVHTLLLHKDYWAGMQQGEGWEQPRENPAPAQDNCPSLPGGLPAAELSSEQLSDSSPRCSMGCDRGSGQGQAHLTAAKRTLMLDSDRPLTIRSIMFSVSMIWAKNSGQCTAFMACWGFGCSIFNVTYKNCS